ncbi:MAG: hypothetical protein PHY28_02085 [Dehalococcoidales bacterium]|nr:hypothetical protein [Dehalococcoidales bacterium]
MAVCWVKAGICGTETTIEITKTSQTKVCVSFVTTCEHIQALAKELTELDIGSEMTKPMNETLTYIIATKYLCRTSCVVPSAILKAMEVSAGLFLPESCAIEFVQGAV